MIIPKAVRERHGWGPGAVLEVEDQGDSVVLRRACQFPSARIGDVYGCLRYHGPPLTIAAMDEAVQRAARKHR